MTSQHNLAYAHRMRTTTRAYGPIGTIEFRADPDRWRFSVRRAPLDRFRAPWRKNIVLAERDRDEYVRNVNRLLSLLIERFAVEILEDELARAEEAVTE